MEIYDDLRQVWLSTATESGLTGETPHADMSEFFADIEKETAADASKFLQPWLAIYDLGLVWLSALHMGSDPLITGKPVPPIEKPRTYLLGAAVAYAIAVRRLVVAGLDSPARVILRSLAEIFWVCLACVADPDMAKAYQAASDSIDAGRTFWYDNLTARKLAPRLNDYEVAAGLDDDLRESLHRFRVNLMEWLSAFVHPSFSVAFLTVMPRAAAEPEMHRLGTFGRCTVESFHTLERASKLLWYFGRLGVVTPRRTGSRLLFTLDLQSRDAYIALVGRETFLRAVEEHWLITSLEGDAAPPN